MEFEPLPPSVGKLSPGGGRGGGEQFVRAVTQLAEDMGVETPVSRCLSCRTWLRLEGINNICVQRTEGKKDKIGD